MREREILKGRYLFVKKKVIIAIILVLLAVGFFIGSHSSDTTQFFPAPTSQQTASPTYPPATLPQTKLWLEPTPAVVNDEGNVDLDVYINTGENKVTAVDLEIAYDPAVLQFVSIEWDELLYRKPELIKKIDAQNGRITFTTDISSDPENPILQGSDEIGKVVFRPVRTGAQQTEVQILPQSSVKAQGIEGSALIKTENTSVHIN